MMATPIEACKGIDTLVRVLKKRTAGKGLRIVTKSRTHEQHLVMVAPATVAWCLNDAGIRKGEGETMRILIVNAKMLDYLDGGQWYRFVPAMLNSRARMEVVANTLDTSNQRESVVKRALKRTMQISTELVEGSLVDAIEGQEDKVFDLAICFGEVLGSHHNDLGREGIKALISKGTSVYLADFSDTVGQMNRFTLECFGIDSELATNMNPYELVSRVNGEQWAGTVTRLTAVNAIEKTPDKEELSALTVTAQMVLDSHQRGFWNYNPMIGQSMPAPNESITCFLDDLGIGKDWTVYDLQTGVRPMGKLDPKWREYIAPCPDGASESERLAWAAHIKWFWIAQDSEKRDASVQEDATKVA